jgi:2-phospho-L-lactate guanylyltransferase
MRTIAILPVKSFGSAKQRLSAALGTGARQALARAMFSDVLASLRRVPGLEAIVVVTADRLAEATARGEGVEVIEDTRQAGQSPAAQLGIEHALAQDFARVLLVPGDTPLLDPGEVAGLLRRSAESGLGLVVVPDRHGSGTNALLLSPPQAIEPAFGPDSRERHVALAAAAGVSCAVETVPTLSLDVDTGQDLELLVATLESRRGHAPSTRGALRQLDRAQAWRRPPVPA